MCIRRLHWKGTRGYQKGGQKKHDQHIPAPDKGEGLTKSKAFVDVACMRVLDCCWEDGISRSVAFSSPLHCRLHSSSVVCPPKLGRIPSLYPECMHAALLRHLEAIGFAPLTGDQISLIFLISVLYTVRIRCIFVTSRENKRRGIKESFAVRWCDCTFNLMKWPVCQIVSGRNRIVHRGMKAHGIVGIAELTKVRCILHILKEGHILAFFTPKCTLVSRQLMPWPSVSFRRQEDGKEIQKMKMILLLIC